MREKLLFLFVLPLVWLVVALVACQPAAEPIHLVAVAPSVWLPFFVDPLTVTTGQLQLAALVPMLLAGLILLRLHMKPRVMGITAAVMTFVLWLVLVLAFPQSAAIKAPKVAFLWLLCCYNFSLCLLPFFALAAKVALMLWHEFTTSRIV